ncbi:MAG: UDP-glucose 4-epimerase GalE [Alphaproteobacteria bacterium HGW-Alphaproteobacteria-2]|nr:MAG: UDP-glucose 4-epimerase GalE [Alphaproteobacteria bacterium HGW-Alphaproteobacteria-2]
MTHVLVTGGAGYIGAHVCKSLARAGFTPVTFDNLSTGWREAVRFGPFEQGDLRDAACLTGVVARWRPVAAMHFAALSLVGQSMADPGRYWRENVTGALNLVEALLSGGCARLVFSSTCATYGDQDGVLLDEDTPQRPINAYGGSKLAIEGMLRDFAASAGLESVIFRYFNVAGADPEAEVGEQHCPETHLIPLVLDAIAGRRAALTLHGTDYPTPDGTCIRDYVHVSDLADAHVTGLTRMLEGRGGGVYCLGTGRGFSVREVIAAAEAVAGRRVPLTEGPRRTGDAAALVCGSARAQADLGWQPARSQLEKMIADAARWHAGPGFAR